jgi:hypothetical protein
MLTFTSVLDFFTAGLAIYGCIMVANVLYPATGLMTREIRAKLLPWAFRDPVVLGAQVVGIHGVVATLAAVCYLPITALALCIVAFITATMVMRSLKRIRRELYLAY